MNGNKIILDTNVILHILGHQIDLNTIPDGELFISFITELELFSYPNLQPSEKSVIEQFIYNAAIIDITSEIKSLTIELRQQHHLKLPDAIICATAQYLDALLITNDKKLAHLTNPQVLWLPFD